MAQVSDYKRMNASEAGFEKDAVGVLGQLASSMRRLIEVTPGPTRRPTDLHRSLGIHAKLAWQVHRVAHAHDALSEAGNVPGAAAMARFLEAAAKRGVPNEYLAEVREAHARFESFVQSHADTRGAFDSMASGITANGSDQVDLHYKRWAYKAASHLWGVQAKAQLSCFIHWPSTENPAMLDLISLRGLVGLRRLRRNVSWVVARSRMTDDDGVTRKVTERQPLEAYEDDPLQLGLLRDFCSKPTPTFRTVAGDEGFVNVSLEGDTVGNQSAVTCLFADVWRAGWPIYRDEHNHYHSHGSMIRTPARVLIRDLLFHEAAKIDPADASAHVLGDHRALTQGIENRDHDRLALREELVYYGKGIEALSTPEIPRYHEILTHVLGRVNLDPRELHVFRLRMEYPVMPSTVVTRIKCAEHAT